MRIVGVAGGIGSGKSELSRALARSTGGVNRVYRSSAPAVLQLSDSLNERDAQLESLRRDAHRWADETYDIHIGVAVRTHQPSYYEAKETSRVAA